ncbi:MAG: outer membrane lipoprotein carrier protein LolA [Gammaproteobacteria bacterium]|nr:outer membrane lipoprotein carrier protein LolA [Gammaproteobacteria bacterium]
MRLTLKTVFVILVLLSTRAGAAQETTGEALQDVVARLAAPDVLRGRFTQTRKIQLISRPLESSGRFILSDMGLYWQQEQPLASVLIADGERLLQQVDDGPLESVDVAKNPMVLTFSKSFLSIFEGNESELRSNFDVALVSAADGWEIRLTPVTYPMAEAINAIILRGRDYIEELNVTSRSLDETTIVFSDLQTLPDQLTEHEIELYAR